MARPHEDPVVVDPEGSWAGGDLPMYDSQYRQDSEFDSSHFFDNFGIPSSTPDSSGITFESPAKTAPRGDSAVSLSRANLQPRASTESTSPASSVQDTSSESSAGRKRKSSEDSARDTLDLKNQDQSSAWNGPNVSTGGPFFGASASTTSGSVDAFAFDQDMDAMNKSMENHFDFDSAASSPGMFGQAAAGNLLQDSVNQLPQAPIGSEMPPHFQPNAFGTASGSNSPLFQTIGMDPTASSMMFKPDPGLPAGDSFGSSLNRGPETPVWPGDMLNDVTSMTPARMHKSLSPNSVASAGLNPAKPELHILPIPSKSRVETQIKVTLLLSHMPRGIQRLHLPAYTISKPKFLAKDTKETEESADMLELTTSLVCTSAMQKPELQERAFARAAGLETPAEPESRLPSADAKGAEDNDDPNLPVNGGEVKICQNCINRENKRAGRRRVKHVDDEQGWKQYEDQRVVVFNTNEVVAWQHCETSDGASPDPTVAKVAAEGGMAIDLPMRIACYCRHQGEKNGFQVIFTLKDSEGSVVAQQMTDSILITDDHKTHAPQPPVSGMPMFTQTPAMGYGAYPVQYDVASGLPRKPYHSSGDLQGLQQHYLSNDFPVTAAPGMDLSQNSSATMTPRNLSRQASPSTQGGPNKKRKPSSGMSHRLPNDLSMTTLSGSQPAAYGQTSAPFMSSNDFMPPTTMPNQIGTAPTTPTSPEGLFRHHRSGSGGMDPAYPAQYYSAPNSAHPSRAPSPVASHRQHYNGYSPQSHAHVASALNGSLVDAPYGGDVPPKPVVNKVIPCEGPKSGGIEVTCLGTNFDRGVEIFFGDVPATATTFWSENTLVCMLPPAIRAGRVPIRITRHGTRGPSPPMPTNQSFRYIDDSEQQLYELALKSIYQQDKHALQGGTLNDYARRILQARSQPGASGMHGMSNAFDGTTFGMVNPEEVLLSCLNVLDMGASTRRPNLNIMGKTGATMLSLASGLGYTRFAAGLLARGADPNSRDRSGFTPLMTATMNGHAGLVRFLILKGADPSLVSIRGYRAVDLAASNEMLFALRRTQHHNRSRSAGAVPFVGRSAHSFTSRRPRTRPSSRQWSMYSSDGEYSTDSDISDDEPGALPARAAAWTRSRQNSGAMPPPIIEPEPPRMMLSPPAWVDQLSAQFQHQLQLMQQVRRPWNLTLQLPALPPMPNFEGYQDYPMVRRISSLVPHRAGSRSNASSDDEGKPHREKDSTAADYSWRDLFFPPTSSPPAYDDIYPEKSSATTATKEQDAGPTGDAATLHAAAETIADRKCAALFDNTHEQTEESSSSSSSTMASTSSTSSGTLEVKLGRKRWTREQEEQLRRIAHARKMKKIKSDRKLFLFWIPIMLFMLVMLSKNGVAQVGAAVASFVDTLRPGVGERVVEVA